MNVVDVAALIGRTPIVDVSLLSPNPRVRLVVKIEGQNPFGSLKDRVAAALLHQMLSAGRLHRGMRIVVPSSGNTGIAVAALASRLGHPTTVVMPGDASPERIRVLHVLGADVAFSPPELGSHGAVAAAARIAAAPAAALLDQYDSDVNPTVHRDTTGDELIAAVPGLTHFVGVFGTGGCLLGVGHRLAAQASGIRTIAVEPPQGERVDGVRRRQSAEVMPLFDRWRGAEVIDGWHTAAGGESRRGVLRLARECGIFAGPSTGLALAGALAVAGRIASGTVAFIACDGGWKYLSAVTPAESSLQKAA